MALHRAPRAAALVLLALAASAAAQQPPAATQPEPPTPPPPAEQPGSDIVVTGTLPLVVDVEQVARRCAACQRALARLQAAAAAPPPTRRRSAPTTIDGETRAAPDLGFGRPIDTQTAGARGMMAYSEAQTRAGITSRRALARPQVDVQALTDRYIQNLLTYVGPIVDREMQERRAPAAYAAGDPQLRDTAATDITDAVIRHLDRDHGDADLLAGPRPG
jgi:hypothetical protein